MRHSINKRPNEYPLAISARDSRQEILINLAGYSLDGVAAVTGLATSSEVAPVDVDFCCACVESTLTPLDF